MAQDWRAKEQERLRYQGTPTRTYRQILTDASSGPVQLVNFVSTWMGCIIWADGTAGAFLQFTLNSQFGPSITPLTVLVPQSRGPFLLTPGTGVSVAVTPGGHGGSNPTAEAIVWEDPTGFLVRTQDRILELLEEQNDADPRVQALRASKGR